MHNLLYITHINSTRVNCVKMFKILVTLTVTALCQQVSVACATQYLL